MRELYFVYLSSVINRKSGKTFAAFSEFDFYPV